VCVCVCVCVCKYTCVCVCVCVNIHIYSPLGYEKAAICSRVCFCFFVVLCVSGCSLAPPPPLFLVRWQIYAAGFLWRHGPAHFPLPFFSLYEQADIRSWVCMSGRHGPDLGLYGRLWKRRWKHLADTRNDKLPRAGFASGSCLLGCPGLLG
jgi:hypothetical protein